jgi:hypothetical protein
MFVPRNSTKPIFYAYPGALQMFFDKIIPSGRIIICKAVLLLPALLNVCLTFMFSAVYQDSSFILFPLDETTSVSLPGFLNWLLVTNYIWNLNFVQLLTRMVWVIAFSSPDSLVISPISLCDQHYFHLSKFRYRDQSCYRDKVYRAAGRRLVGSVFCSPFIKCTLTIKLCSVYRDSHVIRLYMDEKTTSHLPGLAKNSPTLTQTATPHTTGPLGFIAFEKNRSPNRIYCRTNIFRTT